MDEYINRTDIVKRFNIFYRRLCGKSPYFYGGFLTAVDYVKDFPAANVAPITCGRWMKHYRSGTSISEGWVSSCCDMWNERRTNYCPHCGARMDTAEGNNE